MIEDYKIHHQMHTSVSTGRYEITRRGTRRPIMRLQTIYKTNAGDFEPDKWRAAALAEIEKCGETELLEKVKEYCRKNCAWLRKESGLEEYAIDSLCGRSYLHWEDFERREQSEV
ncbi:MAG: hypothetical protein LUG62_01180 [Clostridiales bacterium]|nr:hypothetical protein [Clostridiales bacterium]